MHEGRRLGRDFSVSRCCLILSELEVLATAPMISKLDHDRYRKTSGGTSFKCQHTRHDELLSRKAFSNSRWRSESCPLKMPPQYQNDTNGDVRAPSAAFVCPCDFAFAPPACTSALRPFGVQ